MIQMSRLLCFFFLYNAIQGSGDVYHGVSCPLWKNIETDRLSVHYKIGNENDNKLIFLQIDISASISTIRESLLYNINTTTMTKANETYSNETNMTLVQDNIVSGDRYDFELNNFTFGLTNNNNPVKLKRSDGVLSLSRSPLSFLNQLHSQGTISHKTISFAEWEINFGSYTAETIKRGGLIYTTPIIDYGNQWATQLSRIIFGPVPLTNGSRVPNSIDYAQYFNVVVNLPMVFDSFESSRIIFPLVYANYFRDVFLKEQLKTGLCVIIESAFLIRFDCDCHAINWNDKVYFALDGVLLEFSVVNLNKHYKGKEKKCLFPFVFNSIDHVTFGVLFLQYFNVILNEDNKTIGFPEYSSAYLIESLSSRGVVIQSPVAIVLLYVSSLVLLLGVGCLMMNKIPISIKPLF